MSLKWNEKKWVLLIVLTKWQPRFFIRLTFFFLLVEFSERLMCRAVIKLDLFAFLSQLILTYLSVLTVLMMGVCHLKEAADKVFDFFFLIKSLFVAFSAAASSCLELQELHSTKWDEVSQLFVCCCVRPPPPPYKPKHQIAPPALTETTDAVTPCGHRVSLPLWLWADTLSDPDGPIKPGSIN